MGQIFVAFPEYLNFMEAVIWSFQIKVETLENLCGKVASKFQDTGSSSSQMHTKFLACTILLQYHTIPSVAKAVAERCTNLGFLHLVG